jgi:hypothetical protein
MSRRTKKLLKSLPWLFLSVRYFAALRPRIHPFSYLGSLPWLVARFGGFLGLAGPGLLWRISGHLWAFCLICRIIPHRTPEWVCHIMLRPPQNLVSESMLPHMA